jgi:hypothetical protein
MRRRAAIAVPGLALVAVALGTAGCGGGDGGADGSVALRQTSANLGKVRRGTLTLRFVMRPGQGQGAGGVGVELRGPFSMAGDGPLPVARVAYTQLAGDRRARATFISTGRTAYVEVGGTTYRLPRERAAQLRLGDGGRGLDALRLDARRWVRDPKLSDGPRVAGDETDRVTGELNAAAALSDLLAAARRNGAGPGLSAGEGRRLARRVRESSVEVLTGAKDRLLRRLRMQADLDVPEDLRDRVGGRAALHVDFELGVAGPNRPVEVAAPKDARPLPQNG